MIPKIINKLLV
ncbi:hypothetical protein AKJ16_DCAP24423, partial [Drosera capensis]